MAQLISLSRAARLVGVKRATLQKQIRAGQLHTFEGELDLSEILKLYPQTDVDNSGMIERADRIIEQALGKMAADTHSLPDAEILAVRVTELSHELGTSRALVQRYSKLMNQLRDKLDALAYTLGDNRDVQQLQTWFQEAVNDVNRPSGLPEEVLATDTFLRLMAAHVTLKPSKHDFFVQGPESILESALRSGYRVPYGCTNRQCGKCKVRLLSGHVRKIKSGQSLESEQEMLEAGEILMCANTAINDCLLEVTEIDSPAGIDRQTVPVSVRRVEQLNDRVRALYLTPQQDSRLQFMSGQSVELVYQDMHQLLPVASCPCDETQIELHVEHSPGNPIADYVFGDCQVGDRLEVCGPSGDFVLDVNSVHSLIFIAWGDQFASIKSLVEQAMALDMAEEIWVYWVMPGREKPYLHNLCRAWQDALDNLSYTRLEATESAFAEPVTKTEQHAISDVLATLAQKHYNVRTYDFYVAAPEHTAAYIKRYLIARGVPEAQIKLA